MNFSHGSNPDYWAGVFHHGSIREMIEDVSTNDEEPETSTPTEVQIEYDYMDEQ